MIEFFIAGEPMPKGSYTAVRAGDRAVLIEATPARSKDPEKRRAHREKRRDWAEACRAHAIAWSNLHVRTALQDVAVAVDLTFFLPRPASAKRRAYPARKPDLDKLVRALLDGIAPGQLLWDDSRVVELVARKQFAGEQGPGALVRIWEV